MSNYENLDTVDNSLVQAEDMLSFLAGVTPYEGTYLGPEEEHGQQLILCRVLELIREARRSAEIVRESGTTEPQPAG
ncbi:MAG: hypothetical protein AAGA91_12185 [Pseudomonadota bacterium]